MVVLAVSCVRVCICERGEGGCKKKTESAPSNENNESAVPETDATVTLPDVPDAIVPAADMRHSTVVPLVHDDVAQSTEVTTAVGVRSVEAKAMPLSVAEAPPE